MDDTRTTVYFAGFDPGSTEDEFKDLFSKFGNIEKIFLHKTKTYGMVEFDNNRSCTKAIETLHQQPPLNLYVNMARNQISTSGSSNSNGNAFTSSTKRPQTFNKFNQSQSSNKQPSEYFMDDIVTYDIEDYYIDENNEFVTVFTDPITNEIYVPLRYAPTLRKVSRKIPRKIGSFDEERLSIKSDSSERKVKISKINDSVPNITIQRNLDVDSPSGSNSRRPNNNNSFGNSFDNKKSFDRSNNHNLFDKNQERRRYEHSETTSNRTYGKWNGENRSPNVPVSNRMPTSSKFSKDSTRPQKHFEARNQNSTKDNDEDWNSPESTQLKTSRINSERSAPIKVQQWGTDKKETVPIVPVSSQKTAPKPVQASKTACVATATKSKAKCELKTVELAKDQFTEVHVENIINETIGWVTINNKASEFESLTIDICGAIEAAPTCVPEIGKLVLALYEGLWFRAIILSTSPEIRVRYIDYGNEEAVSNEQIKEIPAAFTKIPAFAVCIKLANGAPCKMVNDITIKVKPIKKENDLIVVHVENGLYDEEEGEKCAKPTEQDNHLLNIFHKLLISQVNVDSTGFIEMSISLSNTEFIAAFMPLNLTEEAAKLQSINPAADPSFKAVVGEIVCAENEDGWQRVYLLQIENGTYRVAFIDFGLIKNVPEVRCLPPQFINIPIFSCVCTSKNGHDLSQVKDAVDFEITNVSGNNIDCTIKINEKPVDIVCTPWDPRKCVPATINKITTPLQEIQLKNGEDVRLEMESDGFLYVRNKQASDIRKKIDQFMAIYGPQATTIIEKPHVGQLVTAEFEGDFYRAIIKCIQNNDATICYIDYGNEETLPFFSLKNLPEEMMREPITIIKIRLRHFINKPFSVKALEYLENLSVKKIVLKATFDKSPEDGYDLKTSNGSSISDELEKLDGPKTQKKQPVEEQNEFYKTIKIPSDNEPKVLMSNLPLEEIPLGKTEVVFQQFSDIDNNILCVCVSNPEILHKVHVELQNQMSKYVSSMVPNVPYEPEMEECVLVQSEGKWYRGACTSEPEDNEYTIFLVDYGSCSQFSSKDMRRMPKEFAKENALCNFAKIDGLPDNASPNLSNRLKTLLERNNSYPVNVLEKIEEDECYIIQFPTINDVLKNEKLI